MIGSVGFAAFTIGILLWFWFDSIALASAIVQRQPAIDFDKGAMYMLGGGTLFTAMLVAVIPKAFFNKDLSEAATDLVGKGLIYGFVLMIILPQLVHFGVWTTLKSWGYVNCRDLGTQWLIHKTFVFTNSAETCMKLVVSRH